MFPSISPKQSFPALESEILAYWKANNTFQKSIDSRPAENPYRFYDGPPFITGTPHYGSLLSSVVKDVVGRYWTMRGKRVDRVWGWDCHGLPIEEKVQKKLGLKSNKEIEERGVKEFIDGCYAYTAKTSAEWDWYIDKIGRWVDMDRTYRTMDQEYMESVMWVFRQLWDKGLIYEGKRVSLYSWKLGTPISNFEVAMDDTYQTVDDPAITVKFELEPNDRFPAGTKVLAWTTTPWTIPANMALAVRNDIDYVLIKYIQSAFLTEIKEGISPEIIDNPIEFLICAKSRYESVIQGKKYDGFEIIGESFKGSELVGLGYIPPFPEYYYARHAELDSASSIGDPEMNSGGQNQKSGRSSKNHKIYHADFITDTDGTGIGHEAPEFGDVDFQLAKREGIFISEAMDEAGKYTAQIFDYEGLHYQEANTVNIERMKANDTLFKLESITHRVPFCPRSGTPLMQKAQSSWFIDIQSQKEKLLQANEQINWFPEHLKYGRFAKGIESAPDWCISRTRYWGAPMPVWQNSDASERVVVSSREEIFELNKPYGQLKKREVEGKVKYFFLGGEFDGVEFNLHKPYIDSIKLQSPKTGEELTRIPEVLDVWMDSGSMPYAQMHYPFENKGAMEASFPADFIAEYVGQVRAWFYVMHVLGVLLNIKKLPHPAGTHPKTTPPPIVGTPSKEGEFGTIPLQSEGVNSAIAEDGVVVPAFLNVITTGVINGNDGRKMSKSFGNYPDPRITIEKYGADPIRFYMLNSPLLSGGDMDFREEQIIETVKGVMLPIWNTYSFFTTYANIDKCEPDDTEIWFSRHGESTSNVANRMSDNSDDPELTEKGISQAHEAGKTLREQGKNFDVIIHTSKIRARDTAQYIADELGYVGECIIDDRFTEQDAGEFAGMKHEDMLAYYNAKTGKNIEFSYENIREIYKEEGGKENIDQFTWRIILAYEDTLKKYQGKKILIVAHAGTSRPILETYFGKSRKVAHFQCQIFNAEPFRLMMTPLTNPLDRWILSKLQVLMGQVHDAMDAYDVSRACRAIVDYMDHLTNWYVRLSRRRFWESGMSLDKESAYETLYTVLVELSKLIAPYMPFLAESIYKGLTDRGSLLKEDAKGNEAGDSALETTGKNPQSAAADSSFAKEFGDNSVHLQYVTFPNRHLIDTDLNRDMEKCENIVSLGLALRSQKNIRVRQPLQSVTITERFDDYYRGIIMNELNVKEVNFENPEKLAKKIAKPDAKKIGPKYGKDVQYIITQAKSGNFIENPDGTILISRNTHTNTMEESIGKNNSDVSSVSVSVSSDFVLESGEYTLEYIPLDGAGDVIGGYGIVLAMDMKITDDLKLEGQARDIVRMIQDMRKEANYNVTDRIELSITGFSLVEDWICDFITTETLSTLVETLSSPDLEKIISDEEMGEVKIMIKR